MSLREQVWKPLLGVRGAAAAVADAALITYYTKNTFHLERLERDIVSLGSELEGLRISLQAIRGRGEDPMAEVDW